MSITSPPPTLMKIPIEEVQRAANLLHDVSKLFVPGSNMRDNTQRLAHELRGYIPEAPTRGEPQTAARDERPVPHSIQAETGRGAPEPSKGFVHTSPERPPFVGPPGPSIVVLDEAAKLPPAAHQTELAPLPVQHPHIGHRYISVRQGRTNGLFFTVIATNGKDRVWALFEDESWTSQLMVKHFEGPKPKYRAIDGTGREG